MNDRLRIKAPRALPVELMTELKEAKAEVLTELRRELKDQAECWLLEEWYRISLPEWRRILNKSIEGQDKKREEYARWMLREILEDPEYEEER